MKTNVKGLVCAVSAAILGCSAAFLSGCAGLVSGTNSTGGSPLTLVITSVQTGSITTTSSQVVWTTNVPANSSVDYGTTSAYGNTTSVDTTMVTSHQMTLSGLAAGTTYYYQVNSTDSKGNHGHGGNSFKTSGYILSGTINPATGGSGSTLTLSGAGNATTTTADNAGNYAFPGLANGTYTVAPSHAGFAFTPSSQSMTVNGANVAGVNFTDSATAVAPTITTQPVNQTVTAGQTATFGVVAGGTAPLSYQWQKNGVNIAGATLASYTTPVTATTDSGSTFDVVVSNTAGSVTSAKATLTVNPALVAGIQVSSNPLNLGNGVVGSNSTQPLIITNTGTATLTITQVNETGGAFKVSGFTLPINVGVGQQTTITVGFVPTAVGPLTGNISIVSNAPSSPTSVTLNGTGIAATLTLSVNPTSLAFGNITTATSSAPQTVTISNTGNSSVTISTITLTGTGYSMTGGSAPVTLSPSQNLVLTVDFSPTVVGSVTGSISIVSNATVSPAPITLTGTGIAPVQHSVTLAWTASTSTVAGYNVYRGTTSGGPYVKINSSLITTLTYTDTTVQSGATYYYVATSVDSSGDESLDSVEVSASTP